MAKRSSSAACAGTRYFSGFVEQDAALMQAAGINVVRTYDTISDIAVLDALLAKGIYVLNVIDAWGGDEPSGVDARVNAVKDHCALDVGARKRMGRRVRMERAARARRSPAASRPAGGPHPDQTFNEEWWAVVDTDRNLRPAYDALKALYTGL